MTTLFFVAALAMLTSFGMSQPCEAASDCDVKIISVKNVKIEEDKITIQAEASVSMVVITPELPADGKSLRFTGRYSTRIKMKADEATFTVLRPHPKVDHKPWTEMTVKAAEALKAGKEIGRIGFYRPDITIRQNRIHAITGRAYIYPKRESKKQPDAAVKPEEDSNIKTEAKASSQAQSALAQSEAVAKKVADPYDVLYDMIMLRQGQDGKIYGHDEIAPLIFTDSKYPFDEESYPKFTAAMDAFAALPQEKIEAYGVVKRALLQHHLWKVFDVSAPEHMSKRLDDGTRLKLAKIRNEARKKVASVIKRLVLTKEEIAALPNPGQATAQSGDFSKQHDPKKKFQPFFPADLFAADSPWVCMGSEQRAIPGLAHTHMVGFRSAFLIYIRLPGGREETLAYLDKLNERVAFPTGTQFALVERAMLISDKGEPTLSPLVLNVQLRAHVKVDFDLKAGWPKDPTQCFAEFAAQPRNLMRGDGVMRAIGPKEGRFKSLCHTGDPFQCNGGPHVHLRLQSCMSCHRQPGLASLRSNYPSLKVREASPLKIGEATAAKKQGHHNWKTLLAIWLEEDDGKLAEN
jgi:hypothetical protein